MKIWRNHNLNTYQDISHISLDCFNQRSQDEKFIKFHFKLTKNRKISNILIHSQNQLFYMHAISHISLICFNQRSRDKCILNTNYITFINKFNFIPKIIKKTVKFCKFPQLPTKNFKITEKLKDFSRHKFVIYN